MGCSPERAENPVASRSPDRRRRQSPPDPRPNPRKNTHFHSLKDVYHALRMEQLRPLKGTKVQTLVKVNLPSTILFYGRCLVSVNFPALKPRIGTWCGAFFFAHTDLASPDRTKW